MASAETGSGRRDPAWTRGRVAVRALGLGAILALAAGLAWSIGPGADRAGALVAQGEAALAQNRVGAALVAANDALALRPDDARAQTLKNRLLDRLKAQGPSPAEQAAVARAEQLAGFRARIAAGQGAQAVADLREHLARTGPEPEASWLLGRALLQAGDPTAAAEALAQAGDFGSDDPTRPEPAPWAGSASCARCHESIVRAQHASRHARTLRVGSELAGIRLPEGPIDDPGMPGVTHTFRRDRETLWLDIQGHEGLYQELIEYAVGSGDRGVSFIGRDPSHQARLCRMSLFDHDRQTHLTPQAPATVTEPTDLMGLRIHDSLTDCLGCHATRLEAGGPRGTPQPVDRAITCERCHGPAGLHEAAVAAGFDDLMIARPRLASAGQINELCGQCHRPPRGQTLAEGDPTLARQQALRLPQSRCFTASGGRLSCVTCHNPHRDAQTDPAHYVQTCLNCHPPATAQVGTRPEGQGPGCPVNPRANCVSCHMPRVPNPDEHTEFTDHFIRAEKAP